MLFRSYQKLTALRKQRLELKARHYKLRGMLNKVGTGYGTVLGSAAMYLAIGGLEDRIAALDLLILKAEQ